LQEHDADCKEMTAAVLQEELQHEITTDNKNTALQDGL
jgi:hypothetical protein